MIGAVVIFVLVTVVITVVVAGGLRRLVNDESDVERRLQSPETHTIRYAVPHGIDPADLRAALLSAGFSSILTNSGSGVCLVVECSEGDRSRVRQVIGSMHETAYDGSDLDLKPVVFEDERHEAA
jgi:hypothetical protein